jgi:DNA-binding CsgD family transcriptional regulator
MICQTSLEALVVVDDDRRHVRVNEGATRLLGAPAEEIVGQTIERFTPPEHHKRLEDLWRQLRRDKRLEGEFEVLRGDGVRSRARFRACWQFGIGEHLIAALEIEPREPWGALTHWTLTVREREILQLAAYGQSRKQIADALFISPATVKTHFGNIYEKLKTPDRVSAVAEALRRGLIQ